MLDLFFNQFEKYLLSNNKRLLVPHPKAFQRLANSENNSSLSEEGLAKLSNPIDYD